jgi:hypothetical protein
LGKLKCPRNRKPGRGGLDEGKEEGGSWFAQEEKAQEAWRERKTLSIFKTFYKLQSYLNSNQI